MPDDINLPIPEPTLEAPQEEPLSKWDLVQYSQDLDPMSMSEDEARAFSDMWAQQMDGGMREVVNPFEPGKRSGYSGDEYFAHDLKLTDPINRVKAIQREWDPTKWPSLASGYEKFKGMSPEQQLEYAKENYGELGGLVGPREALPEKVPMAGARTEWDPITQQEIVRSEIAPGNFFDRLLGEVVFRPSDAPDDPRQQFGLTDDDEFRLIARAEAGERRKAVYDLRRQWEPTLSEAGIEVAKAAARTGSIDTALFSRLDELEKERVAKYAQLLRRYDDANVVSEAVQKAFGSVVDPAWDFATYTFDKGRTAFFASPGVFSEKAAAWGGKKLLDLDQIRKDKRLMDLATDDKFLPRDGLSEGLTIAADSFGPMAYIAASAATGNPLPAFMLMTSYAKETEEMILDATDGKDPEKAAVLGGVGGVMMTYIERMNNVFPMSDAVKRTFTKNISNATLKFTLDRLAGGAKTMTAESGEELLQTWVQTGLKQFGKGEFDQDEMAGVTSETLEAMAKAGIFFAAMGEASPTFKTIFDKYDAGKADTVANKVTNITDKFQSEVPPTEVGIEEVVDALPNDTTVEDLSSALGEAGVASPVEAAKTMMAERGGRVEARQAQTERVVTAEQEATIQKVAKDFGFDAEVVENLTDSTGRFVEGLYKDGKVLVNRIVESDAERVVKEEIFHGLRAENRIQVEEWQFFQGEMGKVIAETGVKENYADLDTLGQLEEAIAKKFADYTPKQKSIIQRALDWLKKVLKINKAEQTLTADQIFQKIQERETGIQPTATAAGEAQSRFRGASPRVLAEAVALGKLSEGETVTVAGLKKMFPDADIDFKEVINDAKDEIMSATEFEVDRIQQMAQFTKAAQRKEVRRAGKEAAKRGKEGEAAKTEAKKQTKKQATKREQEVKEAADKLMPESIDRMEMGEVLSGKQDIDAWVESATVAAKEYLPDNAKADMVNAVIRREMFHQLYQFVKKTKNNHLHSGMMTRLHKIREASTRMKTAKELATEVLDRINKIQKKTAKSKAKAEFEKLIDSEAGKPMKRGDTILKRTLSQDKHAELQVIKQVAGLDETAVKLTKVHVDGALKSISEAGTQDVEETMQELEGVVPILGSRQLRFMNDVSKLNLLKDTLDNYGGVLEHGTVKEIQEATEGLTESILNDSFQVIEAAREMSTKIEKGKESFKSILSKAPGKFAKAIGARGTFSMNIRQQLEQFARADSEGQADAVSELMRILNIDTGNTVEETTRREMYEDVNEDFKKVFGKTLPQMELELSDTKQKWAKYNKLNPGKPLNFQQMVSTITDWEQSDFRETMEEKMKYTPEMIAEIRDEIGPKGLQLIDKLRAFYKKWGIPLDEVTKKVHGTKITIEEPNYMPGARLGVPLYNAATVRKTPVIPLSFADRVSSTKSMDIERGVIERLTNRIDEMAHYISHAEGAVIAQEIFGERTTAKEAIQKHGEDLWINFTNHLNQVMAGGNAFTSNEKGLSKLAAMLSLRGLSGNIPLMPKQLTSFFAPAFRYGLVGLAKEAAKGSQESVAWVQAFDRLRNSDQWKNRAWSGATELVEDSLRAEYGTSDLDALIKEGKARDVVKSISKNLRRAYQLGMLPTRVGDIGAIAIIGPTIYQTKLREHHGNEDIAMSETWAMLQETQQSKALKDRNRLIREGGPWAKLAGMFMSTKGQYFAFVSRAVHDYVANPTGKNAGKLLNTIAVHALLDGAYASLGMVLGWGLFGDEPDEDWQMQLTSDILAGFAGSMPIKGMIAQAGVERMLLGKSSWGGTDFPFQSLKMSAENAADVVKHLAKGDLGSMIEEFNEELGNWITLWRHAQEATVKRGKK